MYTIKQLEAFCVSAALGSFSSAAKELHTTQSAIAKRISELENVSGQRLFDRGSKLLQLTPVGNQLLVEAQQLVMMHQSMIQSITDISKRDERIRIGATDLVGLTWLPTLIQEIRSQYPGIKIEPEIDGGIRLYERLDANQLDLVIMPGPFSSPTIDSVYVGEVTNVWMSSPNLLIDKDVLNADDISSMPVIGQPESSALTVLYKNWFHENGFRYKKVLNCNSLTMVARLTTYGVGISYLPKQYFQSFIQSNLLRILNVRPLLPSVKYYAFYKRNNNSILINHVINLSKRVCNFSSNFSDL